MKFSIVTSEIKVRELREAQTSLDASLRLMARFMIDEASGQRVPEADAMAIIDDMSLDDLQEIQTSFMEAFVPKAQSVRR